MVSYFNDGHANFTRIKVKNKTLILTYETSA
jgi:hypothetical protein